MSTMTRIWRFGAVSVMNVVITQALLQGCLRLTSMTPVWANIVAVGVSSAPAYVVNRRWVWGRQGSHSITREILPFWTYSFVGLAVSTAAVAAIDQRFTSDLAVSVANIGAFALLWVAKYFILDQWLFGRLHDDPADEADEPADAATSPH